jgi:biopolymer transport protein TolR
LRRFKREYRPMADINVTNLVDVVLVIDKKQEIYIDQYKIPMEQFESRLKTIREVKKFRPIFIRADRSVPYGIVIELMARIKKMGIENVGLVTEPERRL